MVQVWPNQLDNVRDAPLVPGRHGVDFVHHNHDFFLGPGKTAHYVVERHSVVDDIFKYNCVLHVGRVVLYDIVPHLLQSANHEMRFPRARRAVHVDTLFVY